ncbi:MAG: hypothetical protein K2P81_05180 [Bacteriovoracaceae bacterium]|nr:hypothetical protein [Bacteriovoracaceae bacterium]
MQKLLKRATSGKLAHFYILNGRQGEFELQKEWTQTFIRRYWSEIESRKIIPQNLLSDADLLWISPPLNDDNEVTNYRVEDFSSLLSFLSYRGLSSQRRFVVVEDVERVSAIIANKLLKSLEESEGDVTFFWLNPHGHKLLSTIDSRAVKFTLCNEIPEKPLKILNELKPKFQTSYPLSQFLEEAKKNYPLEDLFQELLSYEQKNEGDAGLKQELLTFTQDWQRLETFHQSANVRLQWIHTYLQARFRADR